MTTSAGQCEKWLIGKIDVGRWPKHKFVPFTWVVANQGSVWSDWLKMKKAQSWTFHKRWVNDECLYPQLKALKQTPSFSTGMLSVAAGMVLRWLTALRPAWFCRGSPMAEFGAPDWRDRVPEVAMRGSCAVYKKNLEDMSRLDYEKNRVTVDIIWWFSASGVMTHDHFRFNMMNDDMIWHDSKKNGLIWLREKKTAHPGSWNYPLNYPGWGEQTVQMPADFEGIPLSMICKVMLFLNVILILVYI